jgi:hypothetical protein
MDRIVASCILRHDSDKAITAANNAIAALESNVDLLAKEPSIVTTGLDAIDSVYRGLGRGAKQREPIKVRVEAVVKRFIEKGVSEELLKKYTQ